MSASYSWRRVVPTNEHHLSYTVAKALADYFMCEPYELGDNCELTIRDVDALRAIRSLVRDDDVDDINDLIDALNISGARVELVVER